MTAGDSAQLTVMDAQLKDIIMSECRGQLTTMWFTGAVFLKQ